MRGRRAATGYQGRASGGPKNPYYIRRDGHLVAFTVQLKPTAEEINFFNDNFGTPSIARISVLRRGDTRKTRLHHRLITQSERFELDRTSARSPRSCSTRRSRSRRATGSPSRCPPGRRCSSTNLGRTNWWRSSRPRGSCEPPRACASSRWRTCARWRCSAAPITGAAALHRHVHPEQPRDERTGRLSKRPFNPPRHRGSIESMTTEGWIFMVGFRVFDVGLLVVWLIWFFRLRDDDDDSRGDDGGGGEGPGPRPPRRPGRRRHQAAAWFLEARPGPRARPPRSPGLERRRDHEPRCRRPPG